MSTRLVTKTDNHDGSDYKFRQTIDNRYATIVSTRIRMRSLFFAHALYWMLILLAIYLDSITPASAEKSASASLDPKAFLTVRFPWETATAATLTLLVALVFEVFLNQRGDKSSLRTYIALQGFLVPMTIVMAVLQLHFTAWTLTLLLLLQVFAVLLDITGLFWALKLVKLTGSEKSARRV